MCCPLFDTTVSLLSLRTGIMPWYDELCGTCAQATWQLLAYLRYYLQAASNQVFMLITRWLQDAKCENAQVATGSTRYLCLYKQNLQIYLQVVLNELASHALFVILSLQFSISDSGATKR